MNDRLQLAPRAGEAPLEAGLPLHPGAIAGPPLPAPAAGARAAIRVDRACAELRRGRPIALPAAPGDDASADEDKSGVAAWWLAVAVDTLDAQQLLALAAAGTRSSLLLTAERLRAIGYPAASTPRVVELAATPTLAQLQRLAAVAGGPHEPALLGAASVADDALHAALALCKRARLVPALLLWPLTAAQAGALDAADVLRVDPADLARATPARPGALRRVSDARVPIAAHEDTTLVLFREVDGDAEHVAVIVGRPRAGEPVPVRLHSACLTGDLLGSLRCDCGPQLQQAVERLAETGGVLLYLAQEGRGTGLANKLRAYRLQDGGMDTLQADRHLGFRDDERDYAVAAAMLRELGHQRIRLLTNNPQKIGALRAAGIDVVDRMPLHAPLNSHNERYVQTKREHAGHLGVDD
ncbi:MAG: GTP cyclohydrolase II [Rubrivivax sp.]